MPINRISSIIYNPSILRVKEVLKAAAFVRAITPDIDRLNQLIDTYNQLQDPALKRESLYAIYQERERINQKSSNKMVAFCPNYIQQIHQDLFQEIQREFKALGVLSLQKDALAHPEKQVENPHAVDEVLANVSFEAIENLGILLDSGNKLHMKHLSDPAFWEDEALFREFQGFLAEHSMRSLSSGNSKNFILKHKVTKKEYLLKLENRLGMPKQAEYYLRANGLSDVFTPILVERDVSYDEETKEGNYVTCVRTVLVTTVCEGDNLKQATQKHASVQERLDGAIHIYTQMADVLMRIEANGCVFTDMKNTNWLLEKGKLQISDTKGFLFTNAQGQLDISDAEGKNGNYGSCPNTMHMNPREMFLKAPLPSAKQLHAYMYTKNLYQYLTQCSYEDFYVDLDYSDRLKTVHELDFSGAVFQGPQGRDLASLIRSMLNEHNPGTRPSVAFAQLELQRIGEQSPAKIAEREKRMIESLYNDCSILWIELEGLSIDDKGEMDAEMRAFLSSSEQKLMREAKTIEALKAVKSELETKTNDFLASKKDVLKTQCYALFAQIMGFGIHVHGVQDVEMERFISASYTQMEAAETVDDLEALVSEFASTLKMVEKSHHIVTEVTDLINQEGRGMEAKGRRIAEAYVRVPLDKRGAILEVSAGGTKETENVLKEMASSRLLPRFMHGLREGPGGRLSPKKAATMFKAFKARHQDDLPGSKSPQADDEKKPKRP